MRKESPNKEILLQYIYDYGLEQTSKLFNTPQKTIEEIVGINKKEQQYKYNTVIDKPLNKDYEFILQIIAKNYDSLHKSMINYSKDKIYMSQDIEDLFQSAIIKVAEKGIIQDTLTEKNIIDSFIIQFKTLLSYAKKSQYTMKGKVLALEVKNEDDEYIIPAELYNNAYFEETYKE